MTNSSTTSKEHSVEPVSSTRRSLAARTVLALIGIYQRLTPGRPSPCRFYPSCSDYASEAVAVHGALRGVGLALWRVSRCRPLGPHGVDLVPEPKKARSS